VRFMRRYCDGGDLLTKLAEVQQLDEVLVAKIMKQLLSALVYCHSKKILHRYWEHFKA
jgi:calcium-dependent protein kinase